MVLSASEYAILASAAYAREDDVTALKKITEESNGRFSGSDYEILEGDKDFTVFQKKETGEVIVACRGTSGSDDILPDVFIGLGVLGLTSRSRKITKVVHKYNTMGYSVSTTGHSLGGKLAATSAVAEDVMAVTFNQGSSPVDFFSQSIVGKDLLDYHYDNIIHFTNCVDGVSSSACLVDNEHTIKVDAPAGVNILANHKLDQFFTLDDDKYASVLKQKQETIVQRRDTGKTGTALDMVANDDYKLILDRTYYDMRQMMNRLSKMAMGGKASRVTIQNLKLNFTRMKNLYRNIKNMAANGGVIDLNHIELLMDDIEGVWAVNTGEDVMGGVIRRAAERDDWNEFANQSIDEFFKDDDVKNPFEFEGVGDEGGGLGLDEFDNELNGGGVREASAQEEKEIQDYISQDLREGMTFESTSERMSARMRELGWDESQIMKFVEEIGAVKRTLQLSKLLEDMGMPGLSNAVKASYQMGGALKSTVTAGTIRAMRGLYGGITNTAVGGALESGAVAGKQAVKTFMKTDSVVIKTLSGGRVLIQTGKVFKVVVETVGWVLQGVFLGLDVGAVIQENEHIDDLKLALQRDDSITSSLRWKLTQGLDFAEFIRDFDKNKAIVHGVELGLAILCTIFAPEAAWIIWGGIAAQQVSELVTDPIEVERWQEKFIRENYGDPPNMLTYVKVRDKAEKRDESTNVYSDIYNSWILSSEMFNKWKNTFTPTKMDMITTATVSYHDAVQSILHRDGALPGLADNRYEELSTMFIQYDADLFDWGCFVLSRDRYMFDDMIRAGTNMLDYKTYCTLGRYFVMNRNDTVGDKLKRTIKRNELINEREKHARLFKTREHDFLNGGGKPQGDNEDDDDYNDRIDAWMLARHKQEILAHDGSGVYIPPIGWNMGTRTIITRPDGSTCVRVKKRKKLIQQPTQQQKLPRLTPVATSM